MFRRKRSSSHHQPLNPTPSPSAQTAASHAFLASRASSSSLSSAAAAAALRTLSPAPTPVENVQTKRMLQRQSSISSAHTTIGPPVRSQMGVQTLRRANSSGSMAARTFRDQSPRRPVSSGGPPMDVPPIPPLPEGLPSRTASHRRSASLEPPTRVMSPPMKRPSGRGVSLDRAPNATATHSAHRVSNLSTVPELERASSRASVNFSYPITSPRHSPTLGRPDSAQSSPADRGSVDVLSAAETEEVQYTVSHAAEKPVKRKTKALAPGSTEGSHLAAGTAGGRPVGTAVAAAQAASSPVEEPPKPVAQKHHAAPVRKERGPQQTKEKTRPRSLSADQIAVSNVQAASPSVPPEKGEDHQILRPKPKKRPSTVREDHEAEERAEAAAAKAKADRDPTEDRPLQVRVSTPDQSTLVLTQNEQADDTVVIPGLSAFEIVHETPVSQPPPPAQNRLTVHEWEEHRVGRSHSLSPSRSARFSTQLTVSNDGEPLHEPPPRSMSPAKSAMKHSPQQSLSPDRRTPLVIRPGQASSEISDATSIASDEGSRVGPRKKAAKVSFDDEAEIVGVAASPPTSPEDIVPESPPDKTKSKTNWFGLGKKKSPLAERLDGDEFGDYLKPRPVLPSFGSIRGARDPEPEEPVKEPPNASEPAVRSPGAATVVAGLSNDHAIGSIIASSQQKAAQRHSESEPNGATQYVFSPEHHSSLVTQRPAPIKVNGQESAPTNGVLAKKETDGVSLQQDESTRLGGQDTVPAIAVQPATPAVEEERPSVEFTRIPGGFPLSTSPPVVKETPLTAPATQRPLSVTEDGSTDLDSESESDSGDSVYSDAAEDLSAAEGDGFGSINAIVDSPVNPPVAAAPERGAVMLPALETKTLQSDGGAAVSPVSSQGSVDESPAFSSPYPPWPISRPVQEPRPASPPVANMKRPMRPMSADPHQASQLRSALRTSETQETKRHSMSVSPVPGARVPVQGTDRRSMPPNPSLQNGVKANAVGKRAEKRASQPPQGFTGVLRRTTSNGSDSSSSFKRSKRASKDDGQITLRRTMRNSGGGRPQSPDSLASRNGARVLSSGPTSGTMRTSLRGASNQQDKSSIFSGLGKHSKAKSSSQFSSRFADDSDDDTTGPSRRFRSRFDDSSDDEPAVTRMRPVRGIPRRSGADDGDSTDLEDSSEDEAPAAPTIHPEEVSADAPSDPAAVAASLVRGMSQAELEEYLSGSRKRGRSGIFNRLTPKKNRDSGKRVRKSDLESPVRRDTPLERSRAELNHVRGDSAVNGGYGHTTTVTAGSGSPSSPKLHKRSFSKANEHDSWPLRSSGPPLEMREEDEIAGSRQRPLTSDGILKNGTMKGPRDPGDTASENAWASRFRPKHSRRGTDSTFDAASDVVVGRTGKKKRFPMLRRAFGLRD
ncbi:conserved hypothetical protein [Paecilomyces variotii No. 5]|uniref:Uncharacterized protein n=1 Tax=Byssochlamys spectabilis (strain No. 5 / NBRC 109023) TaxID=1356009 RepID=V5G9T0_BYSSN|nr:conserved hypothetical protein [Paecilomyces variotii No. 5]